MEGPWEACAFPFLGLRVPRSAIYRQHDIKPRKQPSREPPSCQGKGPVVFTSYWIPGSSFMSVLDKSGKGHSAFEERTLERDVHTPRFLAIFASVMGRLCVFVCGIWLSWAQVPCIICDLKLSVGSPLWGCYKNYVRVRVGVGFPGGSVGRESSCNARDLGSIPELGRRAWQPTPVFLPGESHGQWRLEGYSP